MPVRQVAIILACLGIGLTTYAGDLAEGKRLTQLQMYDEGIEHLRDLNHKKVENPVDLLFYRACCNFSLLNKEEALDDLYRLVDNYGDCPSRYLETAKLMIQDIRGLKPDTLDEISRLMTDVSRRLDLGRHGERVQNQEQLIIDKLDKLIEEAEKQKQQQQQQQQQASKSSGKSESKGSPMEESQAKLETGKGDVAKKNFPKISWGDLPPKERKEALQKVGDKLPYHYREAIEAYFRKMAVEGRRK